MRQLLILLVLAIVLSACARASTRMLDANTAIISGKGSAFDDHASVVQAAKSGLARFDGKWHGVARSNQPVRCGNALRVELSVRNGSVRGKVTSTGKKGELIDFLGKISEDGRIAIQNRDLVLEGVFSAEGESGEGVVNMLARGCKGPFEVTKV